MMLDFRFVFSSIIFIILDATIETITTFSGESVNDELLGVAASQGYVDFALENEDDSIQIVSLVIN